MLSIFSLYYVPSCSVKNKEREIKKGIKKEKIEKREREGKGVRKREGDTYRKRKVQRENKKRKK